MIFKKVVRRLIRWTFLSLALAYAPAWGGVCRVATNGSIFNNGSTWGVPTSLTQALSVPSICTEIWVKKGLYKPTTGSDIDISFAIADGVAVYGGFIGSETARAQRDPTSNVTVLSGDIDNNDTTDTDGVDVDATHIVGSNSQHVVNLFATGSSITLDGFTLTGGDDHTASGGGGGLLCRPCNATLSRLAFRGNRAAYYGGAMHNESNGSDSSDSNPHLSDVVFSGNVASLGGAFFNFSTNIGIANSTFDRVTFINNHAYSGGALENDSDYGTSNPTLTNVTFIANAADSTGGAIASGGYTGSHEYLATNVTFTGNQAGGDGGALYFQRDGATLRNVILWGNQTPLGNAQPEIGYGGAAVKAVIDHSIVQGSGGSGGAWNSDVGTDGGGNLDANPLLGALANNRGLTQTMLPAGGSPAVDAGNATGCPSSDQRGIVRPQGAACDIGAVETYVVDLIGHKGMEACWSKAVSKPTFLGLVGSNVEGNTACIPPFAFAAFNGTTFVQYSVCYTAACPGGNLGCPITTHTGAFSDGGNFGAGQFTATGTADNFTLAGFSSLGTCNYNASGITTSYAADYVFTDDGNHGDYAALLNQLTALPTAVTLSGAGSDPNCGLSATYLYSYFQAYATLGMSAGLQQKLQNPTAGQSVCPAQ